MKNFKRKRVVAAMSGGVDSSVAAALLKKKGYDVIGISMKLWPKEECGYHRPKSCCSLEAIRDARFVSEKLDIPFYVLDLHKEFKRDVINYFSSEYIRGRTPNPCILCNEKIKFGILLKKAEKLNAAYVATGHYAGINYDKTRKRYVLKEGLDKRKDQSYVLFSLSQDQLSRILLPLSGLKKEGVRRLAKKMGLAIHNKFESQEICFVQDDYAEYLNKDFKDNIKPGPVVDEEGNILGQHKGIPFYTIGQREGLGIAHKYALYVIKIDKKKNSIVVGPKESRFFQKVVIQNLNWIITPDKDSVRARVKIRSQHKKADARLELANGAVRAIFDEPQESPTPGQAAVFYSGNTVLGGGWIGSAS
ncbi:tRNA 2-thiouridine(34) synthase MnmA [Omnitrophica bacterium]|nr:tRNA 2-thiouridine(34) synthase MnmA [Candidatus Omnitrophota bacterium]